MKLVDKLFCLIIFLGSISVMSCNNKTPVIGELDPDCNEYYSALKYIRADLVPNDTISHGQLSVSHELLSYELNEQFFLTTAYEKNVESLLGDGEVCTELVKAYSKPRPDYFIFFSEIKNESFFVEVFEISGGKVFLRANSPLFGESTAYRFSYNHQKELQVQKEILIYN